MNKRITLALSLMTVLATSQAEARWFGRPRRTHYVFVDQPVYVKPRRSARRRRHVYVEQPVYVGQPVQPVYVERPVYVEQPVYVEPVYEADNRDPGVALMQDGFNLMFDAMAHSSRKKHRSSNKVHWTRRHLC